MKKIIFYSLVVYCSLLNTQFAAAQDSIQQAKSNIHFQSLLQAGLLTGKNNSAFQVQSINSVQWKTYSVGIGVGIDDYLFRTIPVFLDVRKDILAKNNSPFIFINAGPQLPLKQDKKNIYAYYNGEFYFNAGAGYKINIFAKNALIISTAFSMKKISEEHNTICDFAPCPENAPLKYTTKNTLNRLSIQAGWMIW